MHSSRFRGVLALLAVVGLTAGFAACGGDDNSNGGDNGQDANALLKETFSNDKSITSGKLALSAKLDAKGSGELAGPIAFELSGPFQSAGSGKVPKFDLDLTVEAQGQKFDAGAVSTSTEGFLLFQNQAYVVPEKTFATFQRAFSEADKQENAQGDATLGSLGINPADWVDDAKVDGNEDVAGVETTKVSANINVPNMLADINDALKQIKDKGLNQGEAIPDGLSDEQRKNIESSIKDPKLTVWTGTDDKIIRKGQLTMTIEIPEERRASANGLESADVDLTIELADVNKPQTITKPANPKPLDELLEAFGGAGALGGLGGSAGGSGGSSSGGSSGGTGGAPDTQALDEYTKCVEAAGQDVQKLQECATKLQSP